MSKFFITIIFNISDEFTLISAFSLGHSKHIDDELFVRSTRKNSNHTLHYLQNISSYIIIECKMHYVIIECKMHYVSFGEKNFK